MASHAQQIEQARIKSLFNAGLPQRYHDETLTGSKNPLTPRLVEWVNVKSLENPGRGLVFVGDNDMEDLAILTARGLHLTMRAVKIMTFMRFSDLLLTERSYLEDQLEKPECLVLFGCGPRQSELASPGDKCFTERERRRLEDRMEAWMGSGQRIIFHTYVKRFGGSFSGEFVQRVAAVCETVESSK